MTQPLPLSALFARTHLPATLLLGGGIALQAVETYISASLMPSVVRDIGGLELMAWTISLFIAASVLGSIFVAVRPQSVSLRMAYIAGALLFALGSSITGFAPDMIVVLIGRVVQGFGAGLLVTMGYSFIRFVYPDGLQNAASTFYSSIWGVSTVVGPSIGGIFADGSNWRWAFFILVPVALIMALVAPKFLPRGEDGRAPADLPLAQIIAIMTAILLVSFGGTAEEPLRRGLLVFAATLCLAVVAVLERRSATRLLPQGAVNLLNPLALVYLVIFMMMTIMGSDIYIPYFLQTLHGVAPLYAGYLVALVALGWTSAALSSARLTGATARRAIAAGTLITAFASALLSIFVAQNNPDGHILILAAASLGLYGLGFGVGLGWAHLVALILRLAPDGEADKATAAINIVQSLGAAFGAAVSGVIVNGFGLVTPGGVAGAQSAALWLHGLYVIPALVALVAGVRLLRVR